MSATLYIAWRYVTYHKVKSLILVVALTSILYIPLAMRVLVGACEKQLMTRAESTPLLIGKKGSSLDLAIDTLYFESKHVEETDASQIERVRESGLATPIPLFTRFNARKHRIVGTTLDYFAFRGLRVERGRQIALLGECVLGCEAAERLGAGPGGSLLSSPESLFDLAGTYPLKMKVVGVLGRSHTPDDLAVFVDLRTAWIIAGLGHGHQDLAEIQDADVLLKKEGNVYTANAKLLHYNEITADNMDSFHFHGVDSEFPITAIIAVPPDQKSADLLRGRYQSAGEVCQIVRPIEIIRGLTQTIFRVEGFLNGVFGMLAGATLLLIVLVTLLSIRLRQREMQTMFKLGCSRLMIASLLTAELGILLLGSIGLTILLTAYTTRYSDEILRGLIL